MPSDSDFLDTALKIATGLLVPGLLGLFKLWRTTVRMEVAIATQSDVVKAQGQSLISARGQVEALRKDIEGTEKQMSNDLNHSMQELRALAATLRGLAENFAATGERTTRSLDLVMDRQAEHEKLLGTHQGTLDMLVRAM